MIINTKGYVIHKQAYSDFDEIITLINEYGNKFTCICLGTRKIESKNARNLIIGNYIEFEFFYSPEKMSKLKSAHTISYLAEQFKINYTLFIMNDLYMKLELNHLKWFNIYQNMIVNLLQEVNDYMNLLYCLVSVYLASGLAINFEYCSSCKTPYHLVAIDFEHYGAVCKSCYVHQKHLKVDLPLFEAYQKMQSQELISLKTIVFKQKEIISLIKQIMFFMHKNLGIYFEDLKVLE